MTTIVNTPGGGDSSSGAGIIIGVVVAILLVAAFIIYGLPYLNHGSAPANPAINISIPAPTGGAQGGAAPAK